MDRNNRGALWKNDRREKDTHPQLQGQATIGGVEFWVSAWTSREGGNKPLVSMTFKEKDSQRTPRDEYIKREEEFDSDLPF